MVSNSLRDFTLRRRCKISWPSSLGEHHHPSNYPSNFHPTARKERRRGEHFRFKIARSVQSIHPRVHSSQSVPSVVTSLECSLRGISIGKGHETPIPISSTPLVCFLCLMLFADPSALQWFRSCDLISLLRHCVQSVRKLSSLPPRLRKTTLSSSLDPAGTQKTGVANQWCSSCNYPSLCSLGPPCLSLPKLDRIGYRRTAILFSFDPNPWDSRP